MKAPAPKPKIVEAPKPKIVQAPKPKVFEAPKVTAKPPVARSVTRVKLPMVTTSNRASQTASLKLVATVPKKMPKKTPTALAETVLTETVKKVVTSAKLKITPVGESTARPLADIRIASRPTSRISTIPSRSPQIRFRSETDLKLKESSAPPTDPAKNPTPKRFRLAQR